MAQAVAAAIEWGLFALMAYTFAVALAGFLPRRAPAPAPPRHRFLVLVPAHDEAAVVAHAVGAALRQDHPRSMFRVVVVADNCSDDTAARARAAGADAVLERHDPRNLGKGHALAWARERALALYPADAVCVFDADNVMAPGFLSAMDARLSAGARVLQGTIEAKNPDDSWVTQASALQHAVAARLFERSRARLGFSALLNGTGYCVRTDVLRAWPPDPACLTDDRELQLRLLRAGVRVEWAPEAVTYDEKPATLAASWRQRVRWARGHLDVARRHTLPLLWRALRHRDLAALDGAVACLQPSRSAVAMLAGAGVAARVAAAALGHPAGPPHVPLGAWLPLLACPVAFPVAALAAERVPARVALRYGYTLLLQAAWAPLLVAGLLRRRDRRWGATRHTRSISVEARLAAGTAAGSTGPRGTVAGPRPGGERVA
ncbi:glycosyltransferase family 2 protein [Anaeromyxobacter dehalogenans]|uniref:Glycosyl transferase, family 2 n=1 Tax=Anaeromyxobacter dehalogenans (strain 2CP-C) TaxID=290397 RepID=Q2IKP9_ANADE|nr:glycosyltransferase family 2 protein [Anaeromyxobacter dehalogenans]ABC82226.1 glycosyl transferase, family 2 [Anaeromyxobacter dehalogenans 2CP-C]